MWGLDRNARDKQLQEHLVKYLPNNGSSTKLISQNKPDLDLPVLKTERVFLNTTFMMNY
jgi:hypothetical protein